MFCNSRIFKTATLLAVTTAFGWVSVQAQNSISANKPTPALSILDTTKEQDGLVGSVRRVKIESAKIEIQDGHEVQGPLRLLELTTYGIKGNRIENTTYPNGESPIGREEYKYDDRGNIIEMTLRDDRGGIINREAYTYEFDSFGNWTKMVTNIVLFEAGKLKLEPIEVTFRTLAYYFDDNIAKIVDGPSPQLMPSVPQPTQLDAEKIQSPDVNLSVAPGSDVGFQPIVAAGDPPPLLLKRTPPTESFVRISAGTSDANMVNPAARDSASIKPEENTAERANVDGRQPNKRETRENPPAAAPESNSSDNGLRSNASNVTTNSDTNVTSQKTAYQYFESGQWNFQQGDMKAAAADFLQSIKLEPKSALVYLNLGHTYLKLDKQKEALNAFKQSVKLDPEKAEAQYGLGLASFSLNRFRESVAAFKAAIALDPKMAKAHFCLGLAYQELGEHAFVVDEYRILERLDPTLAKRLAQSFQNIEATCAATKLCH